MNEELATRLLHRVDRVGVGPAPTAAIVRAGARRRRRRSTLIAATLLIGAGVTGTAVTQILGGEGRQAQTATVSPSTLRGQIQGTWTPETVFGRDVRNFRTSDGTRAVVTFGPRFVDATADSVNDSGGRYKIANNGHFVTYQWATSTVGCLRRAGHQCPTIRTPEALQQATTLRLAGNRLALTDQAGDVIATLTRNPAP